MNRSNRSQNEPFGYRGFVAALLFVTLLHVSFHAKANETSRSSIDIETGAVWQSYNDVQIPGDTGTRFSLSDVAGNSPFSFIRVELLYDVDDRHQLRFLLAPLEYTERGVLEEDVFFADQTFSAGETTEANYKFNSYRASYRYLFYDGPNWRWRIGGTLKIRDARIALKQQGASSSNDDVGVVPLLNLYGNHQFANQWQLIIDFDGLASPQGRAIDLALKLNHHINQHFYIGGGIRILEGGADNDKVYNFAQFNYALVSAGYFF